MGDVVGSGVGSVVGSVVGYAVGAVVGCGVGSAVGSTVGLAVGSVVGSGVDSAYSEQRIKGHYARGSTKLLQKDKRLLQRHPHYRINDNTQEYSKATLG